MNISYQTSMNHFLYKRTDDVVYEVLWHTLNFQLQTQSVLKFKKRKAKCAIELVAQN